MATGTDEKYQQWIRLRTNDYGTPEGRYVLSDGSANAWADYGRWVALRMMLSQTPGAVIDVSDPREAKALARELGLRTTRAVSDFLEALAACDAIDAEMLREGRVMDPDVLAQQQSYQSQVAASKRNGSRGGRPRKATGKDADAPR